MVNSDGSIVLKTKVDTSGIDKGTGDIKSKVNKLSGSFKKLGSVIGAAFGISALVKFGKQAVNLASDIQEVQNVVDTAFGSMTYKIEEFSKNAITQFGISELTAKRTASTYMSMAQGMGIAADVGSDMAISLTGLTADMSSFYNVSQEVADTALKGVFSGETESLKQFGIVMTEVNLQQFAYARGATKSIKAMTQQEKAMLRYKFVLEQTKLAQGDFAKTSDSWANQVRVLSEKNKEIASTFGEIFINIGVLILPAINKMVEYMRAFANLTKEAAAYIYKMFTGKTLDLQKEQNSVVEKTAKNQEKVAEAVEETTKAQKKALAGFDELNILSGEEANKASDVAESGMGDIMSIQPARISDGLGEATTQISEKMAQIMEIIGASLVAVGVILLLTGHIGFGIAFIIAGALSFVSGAASVSGGNLEKFKEELGKMTAAVGTALLAIGVVLCFAGLLPLGISMIVAGAAGIITYIALNWNAITDFMRGEGGKTMAMVGSVLLLVGILLCFAGLIPLGISMIVAGAAGVITYVAFNWDAIVEKVKSVGEKLKKAFKDIWEAIKNSWTEKFSAITDSWSKWTDKIKNFFKGIGNKNPFGGEKRSTYKVPALASGAVLPGGSPFLAMLGDQPSGKTNIEAPEDLIRKIVREEAGQNFTIEATGSMAQLIRLLHLEIKKEDNRTTAWG